LQRQIRARGKVKQAREGEGHREGKRQKAEGRRLMGRGWEVKGEKFWVSGFRFQVGK
jgi:hypothetical protein